MQSVYERLETDAELVDHSCQRVGRSTRSFDFGTDLFLWHQKAGGESVGKTLAIGVSGEVDIESQHLALPRQDVRQLVSEREQRSSRWLRRVDKDQRERSISD